ncbi:glycosyltransferase [Candidatus Microgenomates bacterium]|nr:glycosyltransferase [Candidatus Microgenomates bacterium]
MLISVVVPTYNEEKNIGQTLDSIQKLKHPHFDIEILVVDSSSTDKTPAIVRQHNVKLINEPARGIGRARQRGVLAARGQIVAFTDADTIVPADWLETLVATLREKNVSGAYGFYHIAEGWWAYRLWINRVLPFIMIAGSIVGFHLAPGQNMAFWRDKALSVGGFDESLTIFEDMEMMSALRKVGRVRYLPRLLVVSSGRRGLEKWGFFTRCITSLWKHYILRRSLALFPDFR